MRYFLLDREDGIARLTMNQPKVRNRLSIAVLNELSALLDEIEEDSQSHALIITGAGSAFAAGADIAEMAKMNREQAIEFSRLGQTVFDRIENLNTITFAAINGPAIGGGCELALACDYRMAAEGVRMGQPEIAVGLIPGWGGTRRLARLVGLRSARDLILTGRLVTSEEALQMGLVDQVVSAEELLGAAETHVRNLLAKSPLILQYAKEALRAGTSLLAEEAESKESDIFGRCFETEDAREGLTAFLEKRKPIFTGR